MTTVNHSSDHTKHFFFLGQSWEADAGESQVQGQLQLISETLRGEKEKENIFEIRFGVL